MKKHFLFVAVILCLATLAHAAAPEYLVNKADKGDAHSQYRLGFLYDQEQQYPLARQYYTQAADQDHHAAQAMLGRMYLMGHGARKSYPQAYQWLYLGAEGGDSDARYMLDNISSGMSENELQQGNSLVHSWKATHPSK